MNKPGEKTPFGVDDQFFVAIDGQSKWRLLIWDIATKVRRTMDWLANLDSILQKKLV